MGLGLIALSCNESKKVVAPVAPSEPVIMKDVTREIQGKRKQQRT